MGQQIITLSAATMPRNIQVPEPPPVTLATAPMEGPKTTWEQGARVVSFDTHTQGRIELSREKFRQMIRNLQARTFGQVPAVNLHHDASRGAAGFVLDARVVGDEFELQIEWTPRGRSAVRDEGYRYLSLEFYEDYEDPETGKRHGALLSGAALTIRPAVKRMRAIDPLKLTDDRRPKHELAGVWAIQCEVCERRLGMPSDLPLTDQGAKLLRELDEGYYLTERASRIRADDQVRTLAAGSSSTATDTAVPVAWERAVIRQALSELSALEYLDVGGGPMREQHAEGYSYRDPTGAQAGQLQVYERGEIPRAGIRQTHGTARPIPQKLAFELSNEMRHLFAPGSRGIDFEPLAENQRLLARYLREDLNALAFNEMLRSADEYLTTAVASEDLEPQADGSKRVFVLANFPVVRERREYDLQGNQVGATQHPITVTYNAVEREPYDGTGTQPAGTYYVLDHNLGEIYLVDETGGVLTPADGTPYTISYSYTSNVYAFDLNPASGTLDEHLNQLLYRFRLRASAIQDDRYHACDMSLMGGELRTLVESAAEFRLREQKRGTKLGPDGRIETIGDVPVNIPEGPGIWLRQNRILLGERGTTRLRVVKPFSVSAIEEQRGPNGRFIGVKTAYADQHVVLWTPPELKKAYTSLVVYDSTARVARVDP